jgi:2-methylisocitrate lyase-like PEP mutase family enzyme
MVGKIKAAVDTRVDPDMIIIARTDSRAVEGFDAAIDRMNAYLEAGADVGFVEAPQTAEEMAKIPRSISKPALVNIFEGGKTPPLPAQQLEEMGFRVGIYPSQTHRAAIFAAQEVLAILRRDGDAALFEKRMASFSDREVAVNTARWSELERKYMALD